MALGSDSKETHLKSKAVHSTDQSEIYLKRREK